MIFRIASLGDLDFCGAIHATIKHWFPSIRPYKGHISWGGGFGGVPLGSHDKKFKFVFVKSLHFTNTIGDPTKIIRNTKN